MNASESPAPCRFPIEKMGHLYTRGSEMVLKRRGGMRSKVCFPQSRFLSSSRGMAELLTRYEAVLDSLHRGQLQGAGRVRFLFDDKAEYNVRADEVARRQRLLESCRRSERQGTCFKLNETMYWILRDWSLRAIKSERAKVERMERHWEVRRKEAQSKIEEEERQRRPKARQLIKGKQGEIKWTVWVPLL